MSEHEHTADSPEEPVDLSLNPEAFSAPGAGDAPEDLASGADMALTVGTTCWGTPCPSNNTYSC